MIIGGSTVKVSDPNTIKATVLPVGEPGPKGDKGDPGPAGNGVEVVIADTRPTGLTKEIVWINTAG